MASRFLFNETLWAELRNRIPQAKMVKAAVAYFGTGGRERLPLRPGDKLIVDMSSRAVKSGMTDPREVQKLRNDGVVVYSHESLHAKFIIIDRVVIAGSANISNRAETRLHEAAIVTRGTDVVREAKVAFEELSKGREVSDQYLAKCLAEYRPPRLPDEQRVWIIGGLEYDEIPASEQNAADDVVRHASKKLLGAYENWMVDYFQSTRRERFVERMSEGDFIVLCITAGRRVDVWPPGRFLSVDRITRPNGKFRYLITYASPTKARPMPWSEFRRRARLVPTLEEIDARPIPIHSRREMSDILSLCNDRGLFIRIKR